jgi:hypothetical protein
MRHNCPCKRTWSSRVMHQIDQLTCIGCPPFRGTSHAVTVPLGRPAQPRNRRGSRGWPRVDAGHQSMRPYRHGTDTAFLRCRLDEVLRSQRSGCSGRQEDRRQGRTEYREWHLPERLSHSNELRAELHRRCHSPNWLRRCQWVRQQMVHVSRERHDVVLGEDVRSCRQDRQIAKNE